MMLKNVSLPFDVWDIVGPSSLWSYEFTYMDIGIPVYPHSNHLRPVSQFVPFGKLT